jgi:hypothetical protein
MHKFSFRFKGGAQRIDNASIKFLTFVVDTNAVEHPLYNAIKTGLVEKDKTGGSNVGYTSVTPILKVFAATKGFGIPSEYFSYFVVLNPESSKQIQIRPLGYKKLGSAYDWMFVGTGRFMSKDEIRKFFSSSSDTYKFFTRQSFLSRQRLSELVTIAEPNAPVEKVEEKREESLRLVRFD